MKTVISLPDDLFESLEQIARKTGRSRGEVYLEAMRAYVSRHGREDDLTGQLDAALDEAGSQPGQEMPFLDTLARNTLAASDW